MASDKTNHQRESGLITRVDIEAVLTFIFVHVDDWYQEKGHHLLKGKAGRKPDFSDSEISSLMLAEDYIPYPGETQYLDHIRANHGEFFPKLVDQSQYERTAAEAVIDRITNVELIGDKGFLGVEWQAQMLEQTGNTMTTPKRKNQKIQHPEGFTGLLNSVRERIKGVFHELQNTGRNIERLLAKCVTGLATRIIAKVAVHLLKLILPI